MTQFLKSVAVCRNMSCWLSGQIRLIICSRQSGYIRLIMFSWQNGKICLSCASSWIGLPYNESGSERRWNTMNRVVRGDEIHRMRWITERRWNTMSHVPHSEEVKYIQRIRYNTQRRWKTMNHVQHSKEMKYNESGTLMRGSEIQPYTTLRGGEIQWTLYNTQRRWNTSNQVHFWKAMKYSEPCTPVRGGEILQIICMCITESGWSTSLVLMWGKTSIAEYVSLCKPRSCVRMRPYILIE